MRRLALYLCLLSAACAAPAPAQVVTVYATSAAQLWLANVYACAEDSALAIRIETNAPDVVLQLGEAEDPPAYAYQIGEEEIVVVVNDAIPLQTVTQADVREFFLRGNESAQVWVFPPGADIQRAFDQLALSGSRAASSAKVAAGVEQMLAALNSQSNAVGLLPKRAVSGAVHIIYSAGVVPVLALTPTEPQGAVAALLACLQK